ncbi:hypothetical protein [Streptomyces sp. NPDC051921]|uniref:hypothetical protein n=1 Tax=Streptomyces sp. NPDC051921 TaxID=3155806 RepID=UPI003441A943
MHPRPGITDDDTVEFFVVDAAAPAPHPPAPSVPEASPVFVDTSGRRQRRVRRWGYLLLVPAVGYVALLISALLGGPTVQAPFLPSAQAPHTPTPAPSTGGGNGGPTPAAGDTADRPDTASTPGGSDPTPGEAATPGTGAPSTVPAPVRSTTGPGDTKPTPQGMGTGKPTERPDQGHGKPTSRP